MKTETIVALDFDNKEDAFKTVDDIGGLINYYKVGLELFLSSGAGIIEFLKNRGKKVFLDLKFHDIPNTASKAVAKAASFGADMINIHAQGGYDMMKACAETLGDTCSKLGRDKPFLIAVTLLTSLDMQHLKDFGISCADPKEYVLLLAGQAKLCGLDGVVSSARETKIVKEAFGGSFITVTPGIRPAFYGNKDQKRVMTPGEAAALGTDYIVVGRPVTAAFDPRKAASDIIEELNIQ